MSRSANALRAAAWGCVVLLLILSWTPGDEMIRTGIGGHIEHTVAYTGAAIVIALAYAGRFGLGTVLVCLAAYAGLMEVGQIFVPGRHASPWDFLSSVSGVAIGGALYASARRWRDGRRDGGRHFRLDMRSANVAADDSGEVR
jgi:hypothetical protein